MKGNTNNKKEIYMLYIKKNDLLSHNSHNYGFYRAWGYFRTIATTGGCSLQFEKQPLLGASSTCSTGCGFHARPVGSSINSVIATGFVETSQRHRGTAMATRSSGFSRTQTSRGNSCQNIFNKIRQGKITGVGLTSGSQVRS